MVRSFVTSMLLVAACMLNVVHAQERIATTSEASSSTSIEGFARDFFFCLLENYELQQGGKYYQLYVASASKTSIHVALGKTSDKKFPVNALEVLVFDVPLAWEMTQSGIVEDKAVHVWSQDADLYLSLLSRNPATSDGLTVIPTTAWGKEYVVAAFASYAYLPGYELPSEFTIVANQDSTVVKILPSTDLRRGISTAVAFRRDSLFTIILDRGQSVQFQASAANGDMENYDVTGTVITADKPIGVEAGVMCANVPAEYPYCDHLCEMLLPVDRWGTAFYTVPFINRKGGDGVLVIAAQDQTTITRTSASGTRTHAVLNKFEHYIRHDIDEASRWQSNKPIMLVQYINSTDYPATGANSGIGDPAMVVIPPTSLYEKDVLFQTPKIRTAETQYRNYANLIVHKNAVSSTKFDGQPIAGRFESINLPGVDHILYRGSDIKPGVHSLVSDSATGVYIYGYGSYDAYAWPMSMGSFAKTTTDLIAPALTVTNEECYSEDVVLVDGGAPATGHLIYTIDSLSNSVIDQVTLSGLDHERLGYRFVVTDSSRPAYADLRVLDAAGNRQRIMHRYAPDLPVMPEGTQIYTLEPNSQGDFALPITSGMKIPITNLSARLKRSAQFQVTSAPTTVTAGQTDSIRFSYIQPSIQTYRDTLFVTVDCWRHEIPLQGRSTSVSAYGILDSVLQFNRVVVGNSRTRSTRIFNLGTETFTLDSVTLEANADFRFVPQALPETIVMNDTATVSFEFSPTSTGVKSVWATLHTSLGTTRIRLEGEGLPSSGVQIPAEVADIQIFPNPAKDLLTIQLGPSSPQIITSVRVTDLGGVEVLAPVSPSQVSSYDLDVRSLPPGTYFLEIQAAPDGFFRARFTVAR